MINDINIHVGFTQINSHKLINLECWRGSVPFLANHCGWFMALGPHYQHRTIRDPGTQNVGTVLRRKEHMLDLEAMRSACGLVKKYLQIH